MLFRRTEKSIIGVTQPRHAWLAGELARAWGNQAFDMPEPRDAVICATALHDIGWLEWERNPQCDRYSGLPAEFQNVPAEIHTALWRRGVDFARAYGDYVALLISRHGDAIYERTFDFETARPEAVAAVRNFTAEQRTLQRSLVERCASDPAMTSAVTEAHLDYVKRFIVAVDTMSLNLCWGVADSVAIGDVPQTPNATRSLMLKQLDDTVITVDPWPFRAEGFSVAVEANILIPHASTALDNANTSIRVTLRAP